MRHAPALALLAAALLLTTGCIEWTQKVILNPDGSGKALIDLRLAQDPNTPPMQGQKFDQASASKTVSQFLRTAAADAWTDVTYEVEKDGRLHFTGTAYFRTLESFRFGANMGARNGAVMQMAAHWAKDPAGAMTLTVDPPSDEARGNAMPHHGRMPVNRPDMPEQMVDRMVENARAQWTQMEPQFGPLIDAVKYDWTYQLPGALDKPSVFQPVPGGVRLAVDGKKLHDSMGKLIADDASVRAMVKTGRNVFNTTDPEIWTQMVFGQKGPITVHVTGNLKPQFDYAAESAAAAKAQGEMFKKLNLTDLGPAGAETIEVPTTPVN